MKTLQMNPLRQRPILCRGTVYERIVLRTPVITWADSLPEIAFEFALPHLREGDVLVLSEKMVACTEGRAIALEEIRPRPLAHWLSRLVSVSPRGVGLSMPETMEMAMEECGPARILLAVTAGAAGHLIGKRGWFYRVAGSRAAAIDSPCGLTLEPYDNRVVLAPRNPEQTARTLARLLGTTVLIAGCNETGGRVLGSSDPFLDRALFAEILRDNPLGHPCEQTPMGIIRRGC